MHTFYRILERDKSAVETLCVINMVGDTPVRNVNMFQIARKTFFWHNLKAFDDSTDIIVYTCSCNVASCLILENGEFDTESIA